MVIKYGNDNFAKSVPVKKLDSYKFIKENLFNMLGVDTLTSIQNIGINLEDDSYQYVSAEDSSLSFVTLMHVKNATQFAQFIKDSYGTKNKTEDKNGYQFLNISNNTYIGWNQTVATIVNTTYKNKESYYEYKNRTDTVVVATVATTEAISDSAVSEAAKAAADAAAKTAKTKVYKDGYKAPKKLDKGKKKPAAKKTTSKKVTPKKKTTPKKKVYDEGAVVVEASPYVETYEDSIENRKRDLWEQQQEMIANKIQQTNANKIIANVFTESQNTIGNSIGYKKVIEPEAHVSVWLNTDYLISQYQRYFTRDVYSMIKYAEPSLKKDTTDGFKTGLNIYFEKDKIRMQQKSFSENAAMENLGKQIMQSKQNLSLTNVVNPDNIGYFSMSINTEAMLNYYYTAIKKYMNSMSYMSEYSDAINVYIDLLQIMIDEKGIAELMPGNYMFVLHNMKTKMIDYIDYTYDSEYKSTEVKKSKKELSPNFTFVMDTRRVDFMEKLAKLPLKYAEKQHYNYKDKDGYYELAFDSTKYPVSSLYFIVKDGKALVTTSKEVVTNTITNKGFIIDEETKTSILNNNYSMKIDSKKLFEILESEASTTANKKSAAYMKNNMGNIQTESAFKDGMIQGTTTIKTNGTHANSLEFIFNTIETLNKIKDDEQIEESKKVD